MGLTWLFININAVLASGIGFLFALVDIFMIFRNKTNGEKYRTTLKHLVIFFTLLFTSIGYLFLSIDAFGAPHPIRSSIVFQMGSSSVVISSFLIIGASVYSLLQRAEDYRIAHLHDTDGKEYDNAKKNQTRQGLNRLVCSQFFLT